MHIKLNNVPPVKVSEYGAIQDNLGFKQKPVFFLVIIPDRLDSQANGANDMFI